MEPGGLGTQNVVLVTPPSWPVSPLPGLHGHRDRPVQWPSAGLEKPVSSPCRHLGWKKGSLGLWEEKAKLPTSKWRRAEGIGAPLSHLLLSTSGGGAGGQAGMGSISGVTTQHVCGGPPLSPGPSLGPWGEPLAVTFIPCPPSRSRLTGSVMGSWPQEVEMGSLCAPVRIGSWFHTQLGNSGSLGWAPRFA